MSNMPIDNRREDEEKNLLYNDDDDSVPRRSNWQRPFSPLWWLTNAFLLFVILCLVISRFSTPRALELASDITKVWPKLPHQIIDFQPDNRFVGNLTSPTFIDDVKQHWLGLVPKGLGFIEVSEAEFAEKKGLLPPPLREYPKPTYTTSVTHQLHCLFMIMHGMNDLALNHGSFPSMDMDSDEGLTREGEDPVEHLGHCFDYLRQAIMCHGDVALEGAQTTFGRDVGGSDGWNVAHVCRDWEGVYGWLEERRIDERVWI